MRRLVLAVIAAALCGGFAAAAQPSALFTGASVNAAGVLRLEAAEPYLKQAEAARKAAVEEQVLAHPGASVVSVEFKGDGELWTISAGHASLADSWKRRELKFVRRAVRAGKWFGYAGGQLTRGGDLPSNMWVGRIGTMLLDNRYDAAFSVSRNNFTELDGSGVTTIGLTFRSLHPFTEHTGYNYGAELSRTSYTGYSHISPSVLGGINIYLPGGSFDVTVTCGERGNRGLLIGYTVYIGGGR